MIKDEQDRIQSYKEIQEMQFLLEDPETRKHSLTELSQILRKKPRSWKLEDKQLAEVQNVAAHRGRGQLCHGPPEKYCAFV